MSDASTTTATSNSVSTGSTASGSTGSLNASSTNSSKVSGVTSSTSSSSTTTSTSWLTTLNPSGTASRPTSSNTSSSALANGPSSSTSARHRASISTGEVAGIAMGCAVAGALIAGVIVWLLMRRKSKTATRYPVTADNEARDKFAGASQFPRKVAGDNSVRSRLEGGEGLLPQPVEVRKISKQLSNMETMLKNHCSNFYFSGRVERQSLNQGIDSAILVEASGRGMSTSRLVDRLVNVKTRADTILYVLSTVIFNRLDLTHNSATLLPAGVASCLRSMIAATNTRADDAEQHHILMSRWRVITGYLQSGVYITNAFSTVDERNQAVQATADTINGIISSFAIAENNASRQESLIGIIRDAARFGNELISQPSAWEFDWTNPYPQDSFVAFPCLTQVADDEGRDIAKQSRHSLGQKKIIRDVRN